MASRTKNLTNLKGEKITDIGLSLSNLMKGSNNFDEFIMFLKEFLNVCELKTDI